MHFGIGVETIRVMKTLSFLMKMIVWLEFLFFTKPF